jgi:RNA polymerase-binding transcription factor DksA
MMKEAEAEELILPSYSDRRIYAMAYDRSEARSRLKTRLESLQARLAELSETLREPKDDDSEEQAADLDEDEVLERLSLAGRDEVLLIRAALKRIDDGTYGQCVSCGKPIPEARLRALPETSSCLRCAQRGNE